jgi:hypothetical protein
LLPVLVKALGTTADELLGIKKSKNGGKKKDMRLWSSLKAQGFLNLF